MMKQHVLLELEQFIKAVATERNANVRLTSPSLIRTSLHLLEDLPAARDIVFEYFAMVYDVSVQTYVNNTIIDPQNGLPVPPQQQHQQQSKRDGASTSSAAATTQPIEDEGYVAVQEALENLVSKGPPAWGIVIASWSLDLVGKLSDKNTNTKWKMSIVAACNYWLNSGAMHGLLCLISACFRKLTNAEAESCVESLLAAFQRYPLTFDWVVARLGGCFPLKIISQILNCSLKRFAEDRRFTEDDRCDFESEIGILDDLAFAHEKELSIAFREMLKDGFHPKKTLDASIIPFLLVFCNYSENLLQNLVNVFLEIYNDDLLATIVQKAPLWMSNKAFAKIQPSLNNVALRLNSNGTTLLLSVSKLAEQYPWCQDFLEFTIQELEQIILNARLCPILTDLATEDSKYELWKSCLSLNIYEQQTAVRLLLIVSTQHFHIYYQTISELLRKTYAKNQVDIGALIRIIGGQNGVVEFPDIEPGLKMVFTDVLLQEQFEHYRLITANRVNESLNTFQNLATLTKLEKRNILPFMRQQSLMSVLNDCLPKIMQILDVILTNLILHMNDEAEKRSIEKVKKIQYNYNNNNNNSQSHQNGNDEAPHCSKRRKTEESNDVEQMETDDDIVIDSEKAEEVKKRDNQLILAHTIIDILNIIEAGSKYSVISTSEILKLSTLTVKYFFICLGEKSTLSRSTAINNSLSLLQRQCSGRKAARTACLRELVEGALFYYGYLFGQYDEPDIDALDIPEHEMIIVQNQRQSTGPNANRTVLHAGVIGRGLRPDIMVEESKYDAEMPNLFLKALDACCADMDKQNIIEGYSMISLLLVEMISTDVMYNGLPFPDEEFTKVTMERDLLIRRSFTASPILWALLGFIATHRPALCFSSVLLRALCATCLHQWRARNVNKYQAADRNDELMQCTIKLLQIMAMGQLLPPPLSNLHMIIEHFEAPEIALVLKECVWNYMKDHVPSPALFHSDSNGLHWRNASLAKIPPQYVDTLRNLMQKKLPKLGQHYHQMFIMYDKYNTNDAVPISQPVALSDSVISIEDS